MKGSKGDILFHTINYLIFGLFALICIYPFYYIFIYTISDTQLAAKGGIYLIPKGITIANYQRVLLNKGISHAAFISFARTIIGTGLTLICCSLFGYILSKDELPFKKIIYRFVIITMYFNSGLIPYYLVVRKLGLLNNFLIYVIPGAISGYFLILIKTYIESIPKSLEESAMIDGANYFIVYWKIILPLSKPILATVAVFCAVGQWNSFSDNLIFVTNPALQTLQLMLYRVFNSVVQVSQNVTTSDLARMHNVVQPTPTTIRMTITMIATIPIIAVYPLLQRYFVKGILLGSVKG